MDHLHFDGAQDAGHKGWKKQPSSFPFSQRVVPEEGAVNITCDGCYDDLLPVLVISSRTQHQSRSVFCAGLISEHETDQ
jgi:hypothetical protein